MCAVLTELNAGCVAELRDGGYYVPSRTETRINPELVIGCYSQVYLDGSLVNPGTPTEPFDLGSVNTSSIEAVEIYAADSQVPMRYASHGSKCGVIVLHTRR